MGVPINNVTRRVVYAASGTGPYAFTFEILANTDIAVYRDDTLLTLTTDYTVSINANGTGSVTLTASPTGATQIAIVGNRSIQRLSDFVTGGDLFANTINDELDQQTIFNQQNAEGLQRSLQAPQTDPTSINMVLPRASVRANKVLSFDSNGNPSATEQIGSYRGNWATGTAYFVRDLVKDTSNNNIYQVNTAHTSSGSQPLTTNANASKYDLIVDAAAAATSAAAAASSASAASTSATNAATSASNAATSASAAASSASSAATQASNAATSATAAAGSASTASTQATNAATSATNAANSATSASNSASTATTQATNASNSASTATTQATNASNSASTASTQATNAAASATLANDWATKTSGTVAGGEYSAKYHAQQAATSATNAASSASSASTSASNASTSATNAAGSASTASTAATNASASASAASTSATNAASSATSASNSASTATTQATNAANSASAASTSATNAASSATTASTAATNASNSATAAASSATAAASSATAAQTAQTAAEAAYDSFDDRYLGAKTSNPTVDNDGNALITGAIYFNSVANEMRVWTGSAWQAQAASPDTITERSFTATAGQTSYTFSGGYRVGFTYVWVNGALLDAADITATDGTTITFASALALNDEVRILTFKAVGSIGYTDVSGAVGTANGVMYLNGSKVLTTGSALQFDGNNLGLGVTPSAWGTGYKAFQIGDSALSNYGTGYAFLSQNALFGTSTNTYINSAAASYYRQFIGTHAWFTAPSGTAGNAISFTQAMTLDASGNLGVGATSLSGNGRLELNVPSGNNTNLTFYENGASRWLIGSVTGSNAFRFYDLANATERARITSTGAWSFGPSGSATGTSGQVLTSNGSGSAPSWATPGGVTSLTAGTGISVSGSTGGVTVTNSGVTSVSAGTGISVSASTGGVTISASGGSSYVFLGRVALGSGVGTASISLPAGWQNTYDAIAFTVRGYAFASFGGIPAGHILIDNVTSGFRYNYSAGGAGSNSSNVFYSGTNLFNLLATVSNNYGVAINGFINYSGNYDTLISTFISTGGSQSGWVCGVYNNGFVTGAPSSIQWYNGGYNPSTTYYLTGSFTAWGVKNS